MAKSLSRLLKQRLRKSDLIGRYGGEEFVVILIDVDGSTAVKVLDTIRDDFSQLRHLAEGTEFSVTFSMWGRRCYSVRRRHKIK